MEPEEIMQDQPQFVVETTLDAQMQEEASLAVMTKTANILSYIIYAVCGAMLIYLLVDSIMYTHWKENAIMMVLHAALLVYFLYSQKTGRKKALKRWEENLIRNYGTPALHLTTEFYELSLAQSLRETDDLITDGYSSIKELKESEHLFLLRYANRQYYFIAKDGFAKGTAEEFRTFISARMGGM